MKKVLDTLVHNGILKDGILELSNGKWFRGMLQGYEDCNVRVIVERRKRSKTKEQLGYYWGVVLPEIAHHTGHSPEELHEILKSKFLRKKMVWRNADITTLGSTSDMTTNEMAEFITNVILEAGEMEIEIPEPDKLYQFND